MTLKNKIKYQIQDRPSSITRRCIGNFLWDAVTGELAMSAMASDKWDAFAGFNIKDFCQDQLVRYEFSKRTF
jgi:hypothetical protein